VGGFDTLMVNGRRWSVSSLADIQECRRSYTL
jgi:hypothetical protein